MEGKDSRHPLGVKLLPSGCEGRELLSPWYQGERWAGPRPQVMPGQLCHFVPWCFDPHLVLLGEYRHFSTCSQAPRPLCPCPGRSDLFSPRPSH